MSHSSEALLPTSEEGAGVGAHRPDPHVIVLFGAGGDLAARKLIPGFFHLQAAGLMPEEWRLVGNAEQDYDDEGFRQHAYDVIQKFGRHDGIAEGDFEGFQRRLHYVPLSAGPAAAPGPGGSPPGSCPPPARRSSRAGGRGRSRR